MAEVLKKQRKSNFSSEEVDVLVRTVGKNYETLYGEFSKRAIFRGDRHQAWLDVTKEVNLVSLEKRTLQEVKNKWKKCQHLYKSEESGILTGPDGIDMAKSDVWELLTSIEDDEDSMPLQQRLQAPTPSTSEQEPLLHSQPLSPTKLKVTRHSKSAHASPPPAPLPPPVEEVRLQWNGHHSNMQNCFPNLLLREQYVDATLVAEGQTLKCHRVILSSCSTYFEEVLASISPYQHPVLFMKDIPFWILKSLCDYMYAGEVHIVQTKLQELLAAAANLKIKGLTENPVTDNNPAVKTEPQEVIKEEKKDEEEVKKREEKDLRKKEEIKKKEEVKKKDEVKKKEEVKEVKEKKRAQVTPPPDMPVLKSAKLSKVTQHTEMPNLSKTAKSSRAGVSRRCTKRSEKVETVTKEPSSLFLDPLDLLEPVYEEVTKEPPTTSTPKETKPVPVRRSFPKRLKKRKIPADREESPQPVLSRKGTRSRPNRKVPKFYHSNFDNSTIVREPHTDQADPLMQLQEIKSEPLFLEENAIEIEDNLVGFSEQNITIEEEAIMGDFDSPIVNFARNKTDDSINSKTLKIVNVEDIRGATGQKSLPDPFEEDPLHVQNVIESNANCLGFRISEVITEKEEIRSTEAYKDLGFQITSVVTEKDDNIHEKAMEEETGTCSEMNLQTVTNEVDDNFHENVIKQETNEMTFRILNIHSEVVEIGIHKCQDSGLQENEDKSVPNLVIGTESQTVKEHIECTKEGVPKENHEENLPTPEYLGELADDAMDSTQLEGTNLLLEDTPLEKNDIDDKSLDGPNIGVSKTSHSTEIQSTSNHESINAPEKMQVDYDSDTLVTAEEKLQDVDPPENTEGGSKMEIDNVESNSIDNFAVATEIQTGQEMELGEINMNSQQRTEELSTQPENTPIEDLSDCHKNSNTTLIDNSAELRPTTESNCSLPPEEPPDSLPEEAKFNLGECHSASKRSYDISVLNLTDIQSVLTQPDGAPSEQLIESPADFLKRQNTSDRTCLEDNPAEMRTATHPKYSSPPEEPPDIIPIEAKLNLGDSHSISKCPDDISVLSSTDFQSLDCRPEELLTQPEGAPLDSTCLEDHPAELSGEPSGILPIEDKFDLSLTDFRPVADEVEPVNDFFASDECLQGFSPDEPGFHIAQLAIEQIAQNEEHRLSAMNECEKKSNSSNSNDLETIVNDLTKIVGVSGSGGEEDSIAIAESLENLLNE